MPTENILALIGATLILNASPGPDMIYVFGRTLSQGRSIGALSALGVCAGVFVHAMMAAVGLSAVLVSSEFLFNVIKLAGAAYLVYLGYNTLISTSDMLSAGRERLDHKSAFGAFKQGMFTNILNPKVAIFFMAFLPQFLAKEGLPQTLQLAILGLIVVGIATITQALTVYFASVLSERVFSSVKYVNLVNRGFGVFLIAMGANVALSAA